MTEHVEVDPNTGGRKGTKLARFDLVPVEAMVELAGVYGRGAEKYEDRNWERGYRFGLSFAAMMRHAWAWWGGEDNDPESGQSHMAHVAWHAFTLMTFRRRGIGTDDRPAVVDRRNEIKQKIEEIVKASKAQEDGLATAMSTLSSAVSPAPCPDIEGRDITAKRGGYEWDPDPRWRP